MKVLVATHPSASCFNPAKPVVEELLRRGHEVVWLTGPGVKDKVLRVGARFVPSTAALDDDDDLITRIPAQINDFWRVVKGGKNVDGDDHNEKDSPPFSADVLLVDSCTHAARCFMDLTGTPYATLGLCPLVTLDPEIPPHGSGRQPPTTRLGLWRNQCRHWQAFFRLTFLARPSSVSAELNMVRRRLGLPPRSRWRSYADDAHSPDLHIQMTTPLYEFPRRRLRPSVLFVGPLQTVQTTTATTSDDKTDADWPMPPWWVEMLNHARERVVCIAPGSAALVRPTVEALAHRDDLLVIVTGRHAEGLFGGVEGDEEVIDTDEEDDTDTASTTGLADNYHDAPLKRPANVRTAASVPLLRLLPHVGVMVCDAAYSATLAALGCGVPLVCAARDGDKDRADVASRVAWSGAGIDLGTPAPSADTVRAAVLRIVEAGLGSNSRRDSRSSSSVMVMSAAQTTAAAADDALLPPTACIHGPDHNYRAAAKHIRDDFAQHRGPVEAADAIECLVLRKKTGRRISLGPRRSSLKVPTLGRL